MQGSRGEMKTAQETEDPCGLGIRLQFLRVAASSRVLPRSPTVDAGAAHSCKIN
jgi:hypothetical protein